MRQIVVNNQYGVAEGYIVDSQAEQLTNWMHLRHKEVGDLQEKNDVIETIQENCQNIAFLNNLSVDNQFRGQGKGSEILEQFIEEAYLLNAKTIILFPDIYEENNFSLIEWFESYKFEIALGDEVSGCILIQNWNSLDSACNLTMPISK